MKKSREAQDNIEEGNLHDKNYIIIWNGYAGNGRMHLWLLAIACLIYHRFPEATYIYSGNNVMEYIRATAVAGSIIGEPVEIPSPYGVGSVIEPIGEMLDEIIQEQKYDCMKSEDLYYWDSPTDTISPDIEEALRHIIAQMNKNSKRHQELFDSLSSNIERVQYLKDVLDERIILAEDAWKEIIRESVNVEKLYPYLGFDCFNSEEKVDVKLLRVLAVNYKLLLFLWKNYMKGGCLG